MEDIDKITEERGRNYGDFYGHAAAAQRIKGVLNAALETNTHFAIMSPADKMVVQEGLDMIAHKLGRIVNGNPQYGDSWDDIAGYAKITRERVCKD